MQETDDYFNDSLDICSKVYFSQNKTDNEWTKHYKPSVFINLVSLSELYICIATSKDEIKVINFGGSEIVSLQMSS